MKVSLNTVKQFIDFELPPVDELVKRINEQLGGVEEVIDLGAKYKDAVIVQVVEAEKHPNADKLSVTKIDDGGVAGDVPRDESGYVQVVCGAPNVQAGMFAVWLPPKSTVPASFDDKEPFVLGARELRGVVSQGMLAASDELAIGSDHEGIIEINHEEWKPNDVEIKPGVSFAKTYGLDDTIIDVENKMFTHRPDLFGQLGVAREIAGILGHKFTSPEWYIRAGDGTWNMEDGEQLPLDVFNETSEKVPRVMFVAMKNVDIKPSPLWLQTALVAMGSKPINNIVDVTNYVMLLTAQPTHAYDYDKLRGHKIGARMAKKGEKVKLLNDKTYELTEDDIVIADNDGAIGLGGVMGGSNSEVDETTKNIVLEVATFDMYAVRKSSMRHGVFTDALTRFNKGQSPLQNDHIMNLLMMSIKDVSNAEQASEVFDEKLAHDESNAVVSVSQEFINDRLGLTLSADETNALLENVEMKIDGEFAVTPPFWRTDIELPEDIVEEVGRLYGYDKLPRELPPRSTKPTPLHPDVVAAMRTRHRLARAGANEVLTYSFVHENMLKKAGQDPSQAFRLANALSPDLQYYRLSLLPSLLAHVHANIKAGHDEFALFEIGKAHHNALLDEDGLPKELGRVAGVYAARTLPDPHSAAYYQARRFVDDLYYGRAVVTVRLDHYDVPDFAPFRQMLAPFDPVRTAIVEVDGKLAGAVGEFKASVARHFKLPPHTAGFELFASSLTQAAPVSYQPLSRYPSMQRDVSFVVPVDTDYARVYDAAQHYSNDDIRISTAPMSIYQADASSEKTITLRFVLTPYHKTLGADEASELIDQITEGVMGQTQARVV